MDLKVLEQHQITKTNESVAWIKIRFPVKVWCVHNKSNMHVKSLVALLNTITRIIFYNDSAQHKNTSH